MNYKKLRTQFKKHRGHGKWLKRLKAKTQARGRVLP